MHESFDPYRKWLGIRSPERPLNHYQLLGLEAFEDDLETISNAAEQRMVFVRTLALSQYADLTQRVLNELAAAKVSLLNPDKKIAYDKQLRAREAAAPPPPVATPQRPPVSPHRPMVSPPPASARLPPPARIAPTRIAPPGIAPPRPAADFDPAPLPRLPDLPPWSGAPAVRHRPSSIAARRTRGRNAPMGLWGFAAFGGLLAVIVLVGVITVVTALRKQGGGEVVKIDPSQTDVQPPAPEPKPPPTPEPPKTQPQPPQNLAPSAEIVSVEPEAPEAGGSLTVHLTGRDPEDDAMGFEYRTGANQPWRIAADGRVLLAKLEPGQLTLEVRARDSGGRISATVTRIVTVKPSVPPLAMALFTADQAKRQQEAWANHLECKIEESNSIGMKLILIPPGEFQMGSPPSEVWRQGNELQHRVRITKPFYLGVCEVTQKEYQSVMGKNPSHFSPANVGNDRLRGLGPNAQARPDFYPAGAGIDQLRGLDTDQFPVECVSWDDAVEFCGKLSALAAEQIAGRVYRLPTEAEWEYACRAGTTTAFNFGDQLNGHEANCNGEAPYGTNAKGLNIGRPANVGSYAPNPFGLRDMDGNVSEWCFDWYREYGESVAVVTDPVGDKPGSDRVGRGGGWFYVAAECRPARRHPGPPTAWTYAVGFRVALVASSQSIEPSTQAEQNGVTPSDPLETTPPTSSVSSRAMAKLDAAKVAHDEKVEKLKSDMLDFIKKKEDAARARGEMGLVESVIVQREALEKYGIPPELALKVDKYAAAMTKTNAPMEAAYAAAVKALAKAQEDELAEEVRQQWKAFQEQEGAAMGIMPGAVWEGLTTSTRDQVVNGGRIKAGYQQSSRLSISSVNGREFRGTVSWSDKPGREPVDSSKPIIGTFRNGEIKWEGDGVKTAPHTATIKGRTMEDTCEINVSKLSLKTLK
ncbi:MAG TPA: formylglycine-generating enzyme family protein [Pirellulales bacterium]|nr:formylglycine-generating enzyme family protein [Pirellulales bacterium]